MLSDKVSDNCIKLLVFKCRLIKTKYSYILGALVATVMCQYNAKIVSIFT